MDEEQGVRPWVLAAAEGAQADRGGPQRQKKH